MLGHLIPQYESLRAGGPLIQLVLERRMGMELLTRKLNPQYLSLRARMAFPTDSLTTYRLGLDSGS